MIAWFEPTNTDTNPYIEIEGDVRLDEEAMAELFADGDFWYGGEIDDYADADFSFNTYAQTVTGRTKYLANVKVTQLLEAIDQLEAEDWQIDNSREPEFVSARSDGSDLLISVKLWARRW